jgi:hypothetical protein
MLLLLLLQGTLLLPVHRILPSRLTMPTPSSSASGAATPYMLRQPPTTSMKV